ncbi:MAG TPA: VanZ family protein [Bacteroidota bacterium]|nr:VanZ family protein [Bacteroidota bacterium]
MTDTQNHFVRFKLPVILWALFIFGASSIPGAAFPKLLILQYDKVIHMIFYGIFGCTVFLALEPKSIFPRPAWRRYFWTLLIVTLYGASDEFHQSFVPGRTMDSHDLMADFAGGCVALIFIMMYMRNRRISGNG